MLIATVASTVHPVPQDSTANQRLAEALIQRPVYVYLDELRKGDPKLSWRLIARQLLADTNGQVDVTPETLRSWYGDDTESAA